MPQASDELRARWDDQRAMAYLQGRGYKLERDWTWTKPHSGHQPSKTETEAAIYLITEWDFGGIR